MAFIQGLIRIDPGPDSAVLKQTHAGAQNFKVEFYFGRAEYAKKKLSAATSFRLREFLKIAKGDISLCC